MTNSVIETIKRDGPISYADFMELALYSPRDGYYAAGRNQFAADYLTASMAHPAFGVLIALQAIEMRRLMGAGDFQLVELGAGAGHLINAIAATLNADFPQIAARLTLKAFDRSPAASAPISVETLADWENEPAFSGCVLSNELLDAMPVNKFVVRDGECYEIRVGARDGELVEIEDKQPSRRINAALRSDLDKLPQGYKGEINLEMERWVARLRRKLSRGYVITIDYGGHRVGVRRAGSLRTYYRQTQDRNPLARPTRADITADVDFTMLEKAFEVNGFELCGAVTQRRFLENLGLSDWIANVRRSDMPQSVKQANISAMLKLLAPDGFGGFKVYIHRLNAPSAPLSGLNAERGAAFSEYDFSKPTKMLHNSEIYRGWGAISGYNQIGSA